LKQIAKQQHKIKPLAENQVKVQSRTSKCYGTTAKTLAENCMEFHIYKLKEERSYNVELKNMHYSINTEDIKTKIGKLGHKYLEY
jgi:hypothetical protein